MANTPATTDERRDAGAEDRTGAAAKAPRPNAFSWWQRLIRPILRYHRAPGDKR
jgi:hypothetical protein